MNQNFGGLARGATQLRVDLRKGDITVNTGSGPEWTLEWMSDGNESPEMHREGDLMIVRQRPRHGEYRGTSARRMDVRISVPNGVQSVDLQTGLGRVQAAGVEGRLALNTGNGAVTLHASRGEAILRSGNGELSVEDHEGHLTACTGNGRVSVHRLKGGLDLNTGNGRIEAVEVEGEVRASTGNGQVHLVRVAGEAELNTAHGQVEISEPVALLARATSAAGSVHVSGGSLRGLRVNSTMGGVKCSSLLEAGSYDLSSHMGSIELDLSTRATARIDAQTGFGQVESDFPLVRVGRSGPMGFGGVRMVGSVGDGEPQVEISLRSGKGTIRVRRGTLGSEPHPSKSATKPASQERNWTVLSQPRKSEDVTATPQATDPTLAVLEAVARGELSPQEADEMLRATGAL